MHKDPLQSFTTNVHMLRVKWHEPWKKPAPGQREDLEMTIDSEVTYSWENWKFWTEYKSQQTLVNISGI